MLPSKRYPVFFCSLPCTGDPHTRGGPENEHLITREGHSYTPAHEKLQHVLRGRWQACAGLGPSVMFIVPPVQIQACSISKPEYKRWVKSPARGFVIRLSANCCSCSESGRSWSNRDSASCVCRGLCIICRDASGILLAVRVAAHMDMCLAGLWYLSMGGGRNSP